MATAECEELLRPRMAEAGVVELAPEHVEGARLLRELPRGGAGDAGACGWRFGTGVEPTR